MSSLQTEEQYIDEAAHDEAAHVTDDESLTNDHPDGLVRPAIVDPLTVYDSVGRWVGDYGEYMEHKTGTNGAANWLGVGATRSGKTDFHMELTREYGIKTLGEGEPTICANIKMLSAMKKLVGDELPGKDASGKAQYTHITRASEVKIAGSGLHNKDLYEPLKHVGSLYDNVCVEYLPLCCINAAGIKYAYEWTKDKDAFPNGARFKLDDPQVTDSYAFTDPEYPGEYLTKAVGALATDDIAGPINFGEASDSTSFTFLVWTMANFTGVGNDARTAKLDVKQRVKLATITFGETDVSGGLTQAKFDTLAGGKDDEFGLQYAIRQEVGDRDYGRFFRSLQQKVEKYGAHSTLAVLTAKSGCPNWAGAGGGEKKGQGVWEGFAFFPPSATDCVRTRHEDFKAQQEAGGDSLSLLQMLDKRTVGAGAGCSNLPDDFVFEKKAKPTGTGDGKRPFKAEGGVVRHFSR
jgi:hypothetical protein